VDSGGVLGTVVGNEYLGADTLVACEVPGLGHGAGQGGAGRIVAKLPGRQEPAPGSAMRLGWEAQHEHHFNGASGARV